MSASSKPTNLHSNASQISVSVLDCFTNLRSLPMAGPCVFSPVYLWASLWAMSSNFFQIVLPFSPFTRVLLLKEFNTSLATDFFHCTRLSLWLWWFPDWLPCCSTWFLRFTQKHSQGCRSTQSKATVGENIRI